MKEVRKDESESPLILITKSVPFNKAAFFKKFEDPVLQAKVDKVSFAIYFDGQGKRSLGVNFAFNQRPDEDELKKLACHFEQNFNNEEMLLAVSEWYRRPDYISICWTRS